MRGAPEAFRGRLHRLGRMRPAAQRPAGRRRSPEAGAGVPDRPAGAREAHGVRAAVRRADRRRAGVRVRRARRDRAAPGDGDAGRIVAPIEASSSADGGSKHRHGPRGRKGRKSLSTRPGDARTVRRSMPTFRCPLLAADSMIDATRGSLLCSGRVADEAKDPDPAAFDPKRTLQPGRRSTVFLP